MLTQFFLMVNHQLFVVEAMVVYPALDLEGPVPRPGADQEVPTEDPESTLAPLELVTWAPLLHGYDIAPFGSK